MRGCEGGFAGDRFKRQMDRVGWWGWGVCVDVYYSQPSKGSVEVTSGRLSPTSSGLANPYDKVHQYKRVLQSLMDNMSVRGKSSVSPKKCSRLIQTSLIKQRAGSS